MGSPVRKRLVFYCHGYDPEADTRYRRLLSIGLAQLSRRFHVRRRVADVVDDAAVPASRWTVTAATDAWQTETTYEVLRWDDLVRRDIGRSWLERLPDLVGCLAGALRDGVITNLFRVDWHFALFVLYPWLVLLVAVILALAFGQLAAGLADLALAVPPAVRTVAGLALAAAALRAGHPLLRRAYVYQLLNDWIFNFQHGTGGRPDLDARLDRFGERVVAAVRQDPGQEVLIVGHSTGSILAVEVAARALARDADLGRHGPQVALLTIGAELPVVGYLRKAEPFRQALISLATCGSLLWVEYQAPQDVLNAFRFEPVRDFRLDLGGRAQTNPHIRSPRFRETLRPRIYRRMKWNFFRMHFQFLMPVDIPGEYDYPMIVCGPVALADRIADPEGAIRLAYGLATPPPQTHCYDGRRNTRMR